MSTRRQRKQAKERKRDIRHACKRIAEKQRRERERDRQRGIYRP